MYRNFLTYFTVFCYSLYINMWMTVQQYVTDLKQFVSECTGSLTVFTPNCTSEQLVNGCTAICDLLYNKIRQNFNNMWLIVQNFVTLFTAISNLLTTLYTWVYRYIFLGVQQYCDWRCGILWQSVQQYFTELQQYVTECTKIFNWLYSNKWLTVQQYGTDCTAISYST